MSMASGSGARIRRGEQPAARRRAAPIKRPGKPSARSPSTLSRALATIPVTGATWKRVGNWSAGLLLAGGVVAGVIAMELPQLAGVMLGEAIGEAGFSVRTIEVSGIAGADPKAQYRNRAAVYAAALDQKSRAMPLVDLDAVRARLLRFGWIADARVSRRWPDQLAIDIVERRPTAIWQYHNRLALIDPTGVIVAPVDLARMPDDLPIVIGPGANLHATALAALTAEAPALKPMLAGATWIGGRRWDLRFQSGEVLALPEGEQAVPALKAFQAADERTRLLGRGFIRFDMRLYPAPMTVRISREPGHKVADPAATPAAPADKSV